MPDGADPPFTDADAAARRIVDLVGKEIRVALPLGLGKPVTLLNALTRLACDDPSIRLDIVTALTLEAPGGGEGLRGRFLGPARERLFGAYPEILYARLRREGALPGNITVREFFLMAGNWLGVPDAQQAYVPANYTHALDILRRERPNLLLQLLGGTPDAPNLSCNTDISADLLDLRRGGEVDFLFAAELNAALPVLEGDARIEAGEVDLLLDPAQPFELFSAVKRPVRRADHAIGLNVARLVRDGGTIQIGIGAIGDAVAHALILRDSGRAHAIWDASPFSFAAEAQTGRFEAGLYAVTEMLVDGLLRLFEAGIVRREVDGAAIHAAFFVDSRDFYRRLREMPQLERDRIRMKPVSFTNALYGDEMAKRAARQDATFVNSAMKVTLLGAVVSDALEDGRVVSGVGGQFNFVDQAFALGNGRSVIAVPATRRSGGRVESNIVWDFPHCTIPWHMRDIVVTEYGVAALRGRTDAEAIAALLAIADSRFQDELLEKAKKAGKIPGDHRIPDASRQNTPEALASWLAPHAGDLPTFPFGTDFEPIETALLSALSELDHLSSSWGGRLRLGRAALSGRPHPDEDAALERMGFAPGARGLTALALRAALRLTRD